MKQSIQQKISQGLAMTQQLQQAIFLLQLSSIELKAEIQEKLESNLMLEIEDDEVEENVNEQSEIEEASSNEKIEDIDIETIGEENFENSLTNKKVELINTGLSGLRAKHHYLSLLRSKNLNPDLVIFLQSSTDKLMNNLNEKKKKKNK